MDSINKAFEIFEVFLNYDGELSISDISKLSGINSGTVHRITSILVERGYIIQPKRRGKYSLSTAKLVYLAKTAQQKLKINTIAYPFLRELAQTVDEAVAIASLLGNVAYRVGHKFAWDGLRMTAPGSDDVKPWLKEIYRKGWEI